MDSVLERNSAQNRSRAILTLISRKSWLGIALFFRGNFLLFFVVSSGYARLHDIEPNYKSTIFSEDHRYGRKRAAFPSRRDSLGQAQ